MAEQQTIDETHDWLPTDDLVEWLQLDAPTRVVELVRVAAASYVERQRADLFLPKPDPVTGQPTTDMVLVDSLGGDVPHAGILAAARLWARRSSPAGLASFGEFGAAEVLRLDPDVDRLLGLGRYARPRIG